MQPEPPYLMPSSKSEFHSIAAVRGYSKVFIDSWFAFFKNNFEPTLRGTSEHVDINVIKSWYQLPAAEQFLKLCNQNRKGLLFIRAIASGDCPRAERYFSESGVLRPARLRCSSSCSGVRCFCEKTCRVQRCQCFWEWAFAGSGG